MFGQINFVEIFGAFIVMAAIIDIFGSIPIFMNIKDQNKTIKSRHACLTALGLFLDFLFTGDALLLNILLDYIVISQLDRIHRLLGDNLIFILRKFLGGYCLSSRLICS